MHDWLLATVVALHRATVDDIEHHRAVAEVERHVVAEHAADGRRNRSTSSTLLDVRVADVDGVERLGFTLRVTPQPARLKN